MSSNFHDKVWDDDLKGLQPGDFADFSVKIKNDYEDTTDWYMTNEVIDSLEDTRKDDSGLTGGAYSYVLTYKGNQGDSKDIVLYSSELVGGQDVSKGGQGLHEATNALDDWFYLDTLKKGEGGTVTLRVGLEGETLGNDYQDTFADVEMKFAVELNTPEEDEPKKPDEPVKPDEPEKEKDKKPQNPEEDEEKKRLLQELKGKENVTLDGTKINIFANIGGVDHIGAVLANDAGGIGLFRSEFLYLESSDYPTEEQQFAAYKKVLESMAGKKVIIRTLDIGADKKVDYFDLAKEDNPALGFRAIRICLTRPEIFRTQLRALYRASAFGKLGIMFPMITSVSEVEQIKKICAEVREELRTDGVDFDENAELGIMIETPAAAVISDKLAPLVDFFSVGTNDLTQYTLACDRQNSAVEQFVDTRHEAILRLIEMSAKNAHANGAWIGICGELAADTSLTETFLRMGIDELSVSPSFVLKVRDAVRHTDLS